MNFTRFLFLSGLPIYFLSCTPQEKLPNYLENSRDTTMVDVRLPEVRIQKNDLLSIQIYSQSTQPQVSDVYYNQPLVTGGDGKNAVPGYLVDVQGNIEHHRLGRFHVEGLTKHELAAEIKKRLTEPVQLLADPSVIIRFLNYKVTVMGEVSKSGEILVPGEKINILEALGVSGDITQFGKKNTVKVIRETDGKREIGTIDLSNPNFFNSPYYNLKQNDIVMVEPGKIKAKTVEQAVAAQKISLALTIATVAASIANVIINVARQQ